MLLNGRILERKGRGLTEARHFDGSADIGGVVLEVLREASAKRPEGEILAMGGHENKI